MQSSRVNSCGDWLVKSLVATLNSEMDRVRLRDIVLLNCLFGSSSPRRLRDLEREKRRAVPGRFSSVLPRDLDRWNILGVLDPLESFLSLEAV